MAGLIRVNKIYLYGFGVKENAENILIILERVVVLLDNESKWII